MGVTRRRDKSCIFNANQKQKEEFNKEMTKIDELQRI